MAAGLGAKSLRAGTYSRKVYRKGGGNKYQRGQDAGCLRQLEFDEGSNNEMEG